MNVVKLIVGLWAVGLGLWLVRGDGSSAPLPETATSAPSSRAVLAGGPFYGMAIQVDTAHRTVELFTPLIKQVAGLGADTVMLSVNVYQEHAGSHYPARDPDYTPSRRQLLALFEVAHRCGLRCALMPKVLLSNPRGTEWRGVIQPDNGDWDTWFDHYRRLMVDFARIAAEGNVELFFVGSELVSTEKFTEQWRRIIREIRRVYKGRLAYSANWDHYSVIEFWPDLDLIGMTTYYKLADGPNPTVEQLLTAWRPFKQQILRWQATIGKPLIFTEVGWCSQEGAAARAWDYYQNQVATPAGHEEQRRCYEAFMKTWENVPQVGGVIWWEWTAEQGGPSNYNYTPKGKPAEKELRRFFARRHVRHAIREAAGPAP